MSAPKKFRGYDFTVEDWLALCEMHGNCCASCGEQKPLTVDHIIPQVAGGTDDIANIQPLCHSCNSRKGSLNPETGEWVKLNRRKREEVTATGLRLEPSLHALITEWATEEGRSLNAHIVYLIRQAAAAAGKKEGE